MRETTPYSDPVLVLVAMRYTAGELTPAEVEGFESRLAVDQAARDALEEAVRLSAAASGAPDPTPDPLTRAAVAERLHPTWLSRLFPRRPYRGHPLAWAGVGGTLAVGGLLALTAPPADVPAFTPLTPMAAKVPPTDDGTPPAERVVSQPGGFRGSDPLANPKFNPMGLDDHSPMTHLLPKLPSDPVQPLVGPMPPTPTGSSASAPPEPESKKG